MPAAVLVLLPELDRPPEGVFRLGVRQGLYCLGCCIAMMLLMFAAGAMNVVWMAVLGLVMLIEKMTRAPRMSAAPSASHSSPLG